MASRDSAPDALAKCLTQRQAITDLEESLATQVQAAEASVTDLRRRLDE